MPCPDLIELVDHLLATTKVDPTRLKLEMTESSITKNNAIAVEQLRQLKARHLQVSIDNSGIGYSSLSYLQHLAKPMPANAIMDFVRSYGR